MQSCTRSLANRVITELRLQTHRPPSFGSTAWCSSPPLFRIQSRNVRMKRWSTNSTEGMKREEMMIEALEAKMEKLKAKIEAEEREQEAKMEKAMYHGQPSQKREVQNEIPNHNYYFWGNVLNDQDRKELASHGISTMEQLFAAYESAEAALSKSRTTLDTLPLKLQIAHQFYKDIPRKLYESGMAKTKLAGRRRFKPETVYTDGRD